MSGIWHNLSIGDLFQPDTIFTDSDNDGYPDEVSLTIGIDPKLEDSAVWSGILNLVARLTFEVVMLPQHLLSSNLSLTSGQKKLLILAPGSSPPGYTEALSNSILLRSDSDTVYLAGSCAKSLGAMLNALALGDYRANASSVGTSWDWIKLETDSRLEFYSAHHLLRAEPIAFDSPLAAIASTHDRTASSPIDLLDLTGAQGLYQTPPDHPRSGYLKACLFLCQPRTSNELGLALGHVVSLLALEATEITLPIVFAGNRPDRDIVFKIDEAASAETLIRRLESNDTGGTEILVSGAAPDLSHILTSWFDWAFLQQGPGSEPVVSFRQHVKEFQDLVSGTGYWGRWAHNLLDPTAGNTWQRESVPEVNRQKLQQALSDLGYPAALKAPENPVLTLQKKWTPETDQILEQIRRLPKGVGSLQGMILTSKPFQLRQEIRQKLETILAEKGYQATLTVLNSYKPGLCWLLEQVLPALKNQHALSRLEINYQPFPTGVKALELRSRWLQELFPGPELLAREMGLNPDQVLFNEHSDPACIYQVQAKNAANQVIFKQVFTPATVTMDYLSTAPEIGTIHPCTNGILLQNETGTVLDLALPSDRIAFWTEFQSVWLPELEKQMVERLQQESCTGQAAFWKEIRIDVAIDETETPLDFGDERISPMEALHEDLYFSLLDFFTAFAKRHQLAPDLQLGQVIPQVHAKSQDGTPTATLTAIPLPWSTIPQPIPRFAAHRSEVVALGQEQQNWFVDLKCHNLGFDKEERARLITLATTWGYQAAWRGSEIRLFCPFESFAEKPSRSPNATLNIPRDRMLKAAEVENWLAHLGTLPHLSVWNAATSWQGRAIPVIEAVYNPERKRYSLAKLRLLKPTLLFNARHHANEVSSTSATLELAHFLSTATAGNELLKQANVVMIPLENPDGVALLEELLPECPGHKLHAARYNALGSEFYAEYFQESPRFPEALAKTRAWQRWLPEIMVDQHGVPGHEWDQPFAGNAPYRFREFWLPRTFAYVYIPFIRDSSHPNHPAALRIAEVLSRAMSEELEIAQANQELSKRYRRYAYYPEPEIFPASQGEPLLVLPLQERVNKTNGAVRFPKITQSEIIVELPDEVVSGKAFDLCISANRRIQNTLLRLAQRPIRQMIIESNPASSSCCLRYPGSD